MTRPAQSVSWTAATVTVDQASKAVARSLSPTCRPSWIHPVANPDALLGIMAGGDGRLEVLATALLICALIYFSSRAGRHHPPWTAALVVGGAIGNLLDRFFHGEVLDFLETPVAIVNLADVALTVGIGVLIGERLWERAGQDRSRVI